MFNKPSIWIISSSVYIAAYFLNNRQDFQALCISSNFFVLNNVDNVS